MNFIRVQYNGRKPYTDRTPLKNAWAPGDVKLVPELHASKGPYALLRFAEFSRAEAAHEAAEESAELEQAQAAQATLEAAKVQEHDQKESILLSIEAWDKDTLVEYAAKYDTQLDKRKSVASLRESVGVLVEQFGAR